MQMVQTQVDRCPPNVAKERRDINNCEFDHYNSRTGSDSWAGKRL